MSSSGRCTHTPRCRLCPGRIPGGVAGPGLCVVGCEEDTDPMADAAGWQPGGWMPLALMTAAGQFLAACRRWLRAAARRRPGHELLLLSDCMLFGCRGAGLPQLDRPCQRLAVVRGDLVLGAGPARSVRQLRAGGGLRVRVAIGDGAAAGKSTAVAVTGFVRRECGRRSGRVGAGDGDGRRALLRFLYLDGQITVPLAGAVALGGGLAARRRFPGPSARRTWPGCWTVRDRRSVAVRTSRSPGAARAARWGLRAGEVAALELGDIAGGRARSLSAARAAAATACRCPPTPRRAAVWLAEGRPPDAACPGGSAAALAARPGSHPRACRMSSAAPAPVLVSPRLGCTGCGTQRRPPRSGWRVAEIGQVLRHALPWTPPRSTRPCSRCRRWPGLWQGQR